MIDMFSLPKQNLIEVLEKVRAKKCCSFHSIEECLCESGGDDIDSCYYYGIKKGCYELKLVIELLEKLTNKEYKDILKRKDK